MELRIYDAITKYLSLSPKRFHMPGHKGNADFSKLFLDAPKDVTELDFIDNERVRLLAEKDVAEILGVEFCRFTTDGATSGILSCMYAVKGLGKKIIVSKNSHKSIFNALTICNVEPIVVTGKVVDGVILPPDYDDIKRALDLNPDAIGAFLTYPDYYGNTFDIERVKDLLHARGKLLLVDNSHGGHYRFFDCLKYASHYADLSIDSAHKVLPTLNQGAIICVNDKSLIDSIKGAFDIFTTTSPSYLILASIEYGVKFMQQHGEQSLRLLEEKLSQIKVQLLNLGLGVVENADPLKLTVTFKHNIDVKKVQKLLEERRIFAEMNDGNGILFMFSALTPVSALDGLYVALKEILSKDLKGENQCQRGKLFDAYLYNSQQALPYCTAVNMPKEWVQIKDAVGRISAQNVGFFPPCAPVILAGQKITKEITMALQDNLDCTFGLKDGKIEVIKDITE